MRLDSVWPAILGQICPPMCMTQAPGAPREFHIKSLEFRSCRGGQDFHDIPYQWAPDTNVSEENFKLSGNRIWEWTIVKQTTPFMPFMTPEKPVQNIAQNVAWNSTCSTETVSEKFQQSKKMIHFSHNRILRFIHKENSRKKPTAIPESCPYTKTSCCFLAETWNQIQPGPRPCSKYPGSVGTLPGRSRRLNQNKRKPLEINIRCSGT